MSKHLFPEWEIVLIQVVRKQSCYKFKVIHLDKH